MTPAPARTARLVDQAIGDTLDLFDCRALVRLVQPTLAGPAARSADLYRLHSERPISSAESDARTALDELVEMCSLVSIVSGDLRGALKDRGMFPDSILAILRHSAVERYMTVFYPMAYGTFARADLERQLPEAYLKADALERTLPDWAKAVEAFLTLNAELLSDGKLLDFLFFLDDHQMAHTHISELQRAFANAAAMTDWLDRPERYDLLEGLERFIGFSEGLHALLEEMESLPNLRGRIWLHYSYWLGNGGQRVRETMTWLMQALATIPGDEETLTAGATLGAIFRDLTSIDRYAGHMLESVSPPIQLPLPARIR